MNLWCQNGRMTRRLAPSAWRRPVFARTLLLLIATGSGAYQPPVQQPEQASANELRLNAAEEKDSYEIYSILLRTEMPVQWNITGWAIKQETQTFPNGGSMGFSLNMCLQPTRDQEAIYLPLIEDYVAKNNKKPVLERKFDLPQYALIGPTEMQSIQRRSRVAAGFPFDATVIFHVSAVGFNRDGTRALVYVGHDCGSLCGGGGYHRLVKKDGQWQDDRDYRGITCTWAS
jgi:hypothetical protein